MNLWAIVRRQGVLLNKDNQQKYDCIVFTNKHSISFFLQQNIHDGILILKKNNKMHLIISAFEIPFLKPVNNLTFEAFASKSMFKMLKEYLDKNSYHTIALEAQDITYSRKKKIFDNLNKHLVWLDCSYIRRCKKDFHINKIKKAIAISNKVYTALINYIKKERSKLTELDISWFIQNQICQYKAESAFNVIVASGKNANFPHAIPTKKRIKEGELVTIDFGVKKDYYCSDMTRMISLGKPKSNLQKVYDYVLEAHNASLINLKAGSTFISLHQSAINVFKKHDVNKFFIHSIGHGIGLEVHEPPFFRWDNKEVILEENDIITIEPGLYGIFNTGGRIENMFRVKKNGYELLTKSSMKMVI